MILGRDYVRGWGKKLKDFINVFLQCWLGLAISHSIVACFCVFFGALLCPEYRDGNELKLALNLTVICFVFFFFFSIIAAPLFFIMFRDLGVL